MNIIDHETLFVKMDDVVSALDRYKLKELLGLKRYKQKEMKMYPSEYVTLILLYRYESHNNLKSFWYHYKQINRNDFPNMPSYHIFISWINRLNKLLEYILKQYMSTLNQELGMVDSTKLETSKSYRKGKVHRTAKTGYSSLGMFKGFKLHVLANEKGSVCNYRITPANVHDINPVKEGLFDGHTGLILADSGYVGKDVYHQLMMKNIRFIAKPKSNMMVYNESGLGYLPPWKSHFKKLYKKRLSIERLFGYLKDNLNMVLNKLHSTESLYSHVTSTLLANQMIKAKHITYRII